MAFNAVFAWFIGKRMNRVNFYRDNPIASQRSVNEYLNYQLQQTHFYREQQLLLGRGDIQLSEIQLQDYGSLKPYIDRTIQGEENVLWPGETKWFAQSSGTTADRKKLIPVTLQSLEENHYANGKDLLAQYYANLPNRKLFNAKHLIVGGSGEIRKENNGVFIGDLSAII
ncbi:MAG: GH3 auxin-responsive promoter family protein, partial [Crocinitomicaceae bacterium]